MYNNFVNWMNTGGNQFMSTIKTEAIFIEIERLLK